MVGKKPTKRSKHGGDSSPAEEADFTLCGMCRASQWDRVLSLLEQTPSIALEMLKMDNNNSTTVLHQVITTRSPNTQPRFDVIKHILKETPEAARIKNGFGSLPLHVVAQRNIKLDAATKEKVILALVDAYPGALFVEGGVGRRSPLHIVFTDYTSSKVVKRMIDAGREATLVKDKKGWLPIHVAASRHSSPEKISMLLNACPKSLFAKTDDGETPLQLAISTATKTHPNHTLIKHLKAAEAKYYQDDGNDIDEQDMLHALTPKRRLRDSDTVGGARKAKRSKVRKTKRSSVGGGPNVQDTCDASTRTPSPSSPECHEYVDWRASSPPPLPEPHIATLETDEVLEEESVSPKAIEFSEEERQEALTLLFFRQGGEEPKNAAAPDSDSAKTAETPIDVGVSPTESDSPDDPPPRIEVQLPKQADEDPESDSAFKDGGPTEMPMRSGCKTTETSPSSEDRRPQHGLHRKVEMAPLVCGLEAGIQSRSQFWDRDGPRSCTKAMSKEKIVKAEERSGSQSRAQSSPGHDPRSLAAYVSKKHILKTERRSPVEQAPQARTRSHPVQCTPAAQSRAKQHSDDDLPSSQRAAAAQEQEGNPARNMFEFPSALASEYRVPQSMRKGSADSPNNGVLGRPSLKHPGALLVSTRLGAPSSASPVRPRRGLREPMVAFKESSSSSSISSGVLGAGKGDARGGRRPSILQIPHYSNSKGKRDRDVGFGGVGVPQIRMHGHEIAWTASDVSRLYDSERRRNQEMIIMRRRLQQQKQQREREERLPVPMVRHSPSTSLRTSTATPTTTTSGWLSPLNLFEGSASQSRRHPLLQRPEQPRQPKRNPNPTPARGTFPHSFHPSPRRPLPLSAVSSSSSKLRVGMNMSFKNAQVSISTAPRSRMRLPAVVPDPSGVRRPSRSLQHSLDHEHQYHFEAPPSAPSMHYYHHGRQVLASRKEPARRDKVQWYTPYMGDC
jgi:hypothetical protein